MATAGIDSYVVVEQHDTMTVHDPDTPALIGEILIQQVHSETPRWTTIPLTNQHNQWTDALTGMTPRGNIPPGDAGGSAR